jgi:hypothetical protein
MADTKTLSIALPVVVLVVLVVVVVVLVVVRASPNSPPSPLPLSARGSDVVQVDVHAYVAGDGGIKSAAM